MALTSALSIVWSEIVAPELTPNDPMLLVFVTMNPSSIGEVSAACVLAGDELADRVLAGEAVRGLWLPAGAFPGAVGVPRP
jgi:hypothetical protein